MKYITKKRLTVFLTLTIFGIAGFVVWSSAQSKNVERVIIENKTRSLAVESISELDNGGELSKFEVTVKNNYDKPISIYRFRMSDDSTKKGDIHAVERGGLTDGWTLKPNETAVTRFSADKQGKVFLIVAAVLFEDGTGDGLVTDVTSLQDVRKGVLLGFQKLIPFLKDEAETSNFLSSETAFEDLKNKIERADDDIIPDVSKRGFGLVQGFIKMEIQDLREKIKSKSDLDANAEFLSKIAEMESRITTLSENSSSHKDEKGGKHEN